MTTVTFTPSQKVTYLPNLAARSGWSPVLPAQIHEPLDWAIWLRIAGTREWQEGLHAAGLFLETRHLFDQIISMWRDAALPCMR